MKTESLSDWREPIDLLPLKKRISSAAAKRERQKKNYKTSKQWSDEATNLTGLKGEYAFSLCTGLPVDYELRKCGDTGADFIHEGLLYDIKTTTFQGNDPALLEKTDKNLIPHIYVLVRVCGWSASIVGWASRKQMRRSDQKSFGHGMMLCLKQSQLEELGQDTIPPCVPSVSTDVNAARIRAGRQKRNTKELIKLPYSPLKPSGNEKLCFPHGPFEARVGFESGKDAMYCKKCGRFYGYKEAAPVFPIPK